MPTIAPRAALQGFAAHHWSESSGFHSRYERGPGLAKWRQVVRGLGEILGPNPRPGLGSRHGKTIDENYRNLSDLMSLDSARTCVL